MGAYLSEPVTEKQSCDISNDLFNCAASSMQGWRISQEDSHNLILNFDKETSLFAVYDGHGGPEVALYCADKLPDFIRSTDAYKNGNIEQALKEAFLGFDASIAEQSVIDILKELSLSKIGSDKEDISSEEDVASLYQEASMPLDKLLAKYKSRETSESKGNDGLQRGKYLNLGESSGCSSAKVKSPEGNDHDCVSSSCNTITETTSECSMNGHCSSDLGNLTIGEEKKKSKSQVPDSSQNITNSNDIKNLNSSNSENLNGTSPKENDETDTKENCDAVCSSSTENISSGSSKPKGKGKNPAVRSTTKEQCRRLIQNYAQSLLSTSDSESDDSEDHDETFDDDSSNETVEDDGDENASEEEGSDSCDDEYLDTDPQDEEFIASMREEPGSDSGCTAVVAIIRENMLYVANAGDSRCILCRNGQALDMSVDHKPEDAEERERIVKAGGRVTNDGRVNGGLNLSRAIGDHAYKQNKELLPEHQMISAMPDVRQIPLTPEDEFLVLACDGVWNYMNSQETVDFIKYKLQGDTKLSNVIEQMFDHCLAPNTTGDGTGCDNMTAVIVHFKPSAFASLTRNVSSRKRLQPEVNCEQHSNLVKKTKTGSDEDLLNKQKTLVEEKSNMSSSANAEN